MEDSYALRRDKKILSFTVTLQKFFGSVGRKKNFLYEIFVTRHTNFEDMTFLISEPITMQFLACTFQTVVTGRPKKSSRN